jgi:peptidyl-tRNA hydrolase, PTH1 family
MLRNFFRKFVGQNNVDSMKYLIAGLGNIGPKYSKTRHNIGFEVLDALAGASNLVFESNRYGDTTMFRHKGRSVLLLKPSTFMNLSGKAIDYWLKKENIPEENLLVIVDDIALPLGILRLRPKGGDAGHNGLKNIQQILGHQNYARLRVGIGNNFPLGHQVDYVLGNWDEDEYKTVSAKFETASEIVKSFVTIGIEKTMTLYNKNNE